MHGSQVITLFNMVRAPLNVIPTWIVQILQTGVALNRIAVYLAEDEVDEQVSSLKKDALSPSPSLPPPLNSNVVREEEIEGHASQTPWLQHQSIRSNILFNAPFEDGDMMEIGARGVSLSGGQKARVALARAVYDRARWVVLDDPLSAVDSGTAGWIVERLLGGELFS
ncbi:hypothetical protein C0995_013193 [Termitomyces sp. Mi166|nr:hypothetical protein C0995_013193 [Termitomyces sp. Mi166\